MLGGTWQFPFATSSFLRLYPESPGAICTPVGCERIRASASGEPATQPSTGAPTQTAQGENGGHLDGDLTQEAKMAGLAHENSMDTHLWDENRLIMHPERTMGASSTWKFNVDDGDDMCVCV
ncbi:unnamed protein product [Leuciscus chuanchicus]